MLRNRYENILFDNDDLREKDYLDNLIYAENLAQKIMEYYDSDKNKPLYIALTGAWGSGKSTVAHTAIKMINEKQKEKVKVFNYDAWKYEGDSFRRTFTRSILDNSGISKNSPKYKEFYNRMYDDKSVEKSSVKENLVLSEHIDRSYSLIQSFILVFMVLFVFIGTIIMVINLFEDKLIIAFSVILSIISNLGGLSVLFKYGIDFFNNSFNAKVTYVFQKLFSPEQFYDTVNEILKGIKENKIILIDNIDRCNQEEFKETISSIKGFFNDEGKIVYIIPFDIEQFSLAYDTEYQSYSEKVFDYSIDLKEKSQKNVIEFVDKLLVDEDGYSDLFTNESVDIIAKSGCKTPRQIINICNDYVTEYNLFVVKNHLNVDDIQKDDLSYLMKYTILKKYHFDLFTKIHINIDIIKRLENSAFSRLLYDNVKNSYPWLNSASYNFLRKTYAIMPTDYAYFYSSQSKDDFYLDEDILDAIQSREYEKVNQLLVDSNKKDSILKYMKKSIMYEKNKNLWKTSIVPKVNLLIFLLKNETLTSDDINLYLDFLLKDDDFLPKVIFSLDVSIEDSIKFVNIMSDKYEKKYNLIEKVINGLITSRFEFNDDDKLESISKVFSELNIIQLNDDQNKFFVEHFDNVLKSYIYSEIPHINIFKSNVKKYITADQIKRIIDSVSVDENNIFECLVNLFIDMPKDKMDNNLFGSFINFVNRIYPKAESKEFFVNLFEYLYDNVKDDPLKIYIERINVNKIPEEYTDFHLCDLLIDLYNITCVNSLKNLILSVNVKENKEYIYNRLINESQYNENIILLFKDLINKMSEEDFEENVSKITKFYERANEDFKNWLNQIIYSNYFKLAENFYNELSNHENKDYFSEFVVNLPLSYEQKIEKIKIFMTSNDRFYKIIDNQNELSRLEKLLELINNHYKTIVVNKITNIIEGKSSIINDDLEAVIKMLENEELSLQNKKSVLSSLGVQKTNVEDLKRIYEVLPNSSTIRKEADIIRSILIEQGVLKDNKAREESDIKVKKG